MIVIINGAPGSGKTKTAEYLFLHTEHSALIDGDVMLTINPQKRTEEELTLREENIAAVAKNYHRHGYSIIFLAFVYMGPLYLAKQVDLLQEIDSVKVVGLVPTERTLRERHMHDEYKREGIESSIEINKKIAALKDMHIIDNSSLTIEEVAGKIKSIVGLT